MLPRVFTGTTQPKPLRTEQARNLETSTVRLTWNETVDWMCSVICRLNISAAQRAELVESLMEELGLSQAADTPVGTIFIKGISGGQKRRLSIAQEVLVSPSVMFLDEPTSGTAVLLLMWGISATHDERCGDTAWHQHEAVFEVSFSPAISSDL